jgi:hypothetical protein
MLEVDKGLHVLLAGGQRRSGGRVADLVAGAVLVQFRRE